MSKNSLFNKWCWENWTGTCEIKKEARPPTHTIHQNKLKMDKGLNISHDTIKVLMENTGSKISDIPHSNIFAYISLRAREIRKKK